MRFFGTDNAIFAALAADAQNANVEHFVSDEGPPEAQFSSLCTAEGDCTTCDLIVFMLRIAYWIFTVLGAASVLMFVAAGVLLLTSRGNTTFVDRGKGFIKGSLVGIALALAAFGIVNFVVNALLNPEPASSLSTVARVFTTQNWNEFSCPDYPQAPPPSAIVNTTPTTPPQQSTVPPGTDTEDEARAYLAACGVSVNNDPCKSGQSSGCTNVDDMRAETLQIACSFADFCNSSQVVVTGGTEGAHTAGTYSHGTGYKVDIDDSSVVTNCVLNNPSRFQYGGTRGGDRVYCDTVTGDEWTQESDHFDVKAGSAPSTYCDA